MNPIDLAPALIFDTETTGLINWRAPDAHESQPHIVSLAIRLESHSGEPLVEWETLIQPDGWTVPDAAARVHGITTERAQREGRPLRVALEWLTSHALTAAVAVAHNYDFDNRVIATAAARVGIKHPLAALPHFCTMKAMTPICKLPGRASGWKYPNLTEAHREAIGASFDGAHSALADVRACARVLRWLRTHHR